MPKVTQLWSRCSASMSWDRENKTQSDCRRIIGGTVYFNPSYATYCWCRTCIRTEHRRNQSRPYWTPLVPRCRRTLIDRTLKTVDVQMRSQVTVSGLFIKLQVVPVQTFSVKYSARFERMNEWVSEWVGEWVNEWTNEWMSEWLNERMNEWMSEWVNEWVGWWVGGWMTDWLNEWMNEWMFAQHRNNVNVKNTQWAVQHGSKNGTNSCPR